MLTLTCFGEADHLGKLRRGAAGRAVLLTVMLEQGLTPNSTTGTRARLVTIGSLSSSRFLLRRRFLCALCQGQSWGAGLRFPHSVLVFLDGCEIPDYVDDPLWANRSQRGGRSGRSDKSRSSGGYRRPPRFPCGASSRSAPLAVTDLPPSARSVG